MRLCQVCSGRPSRRHVLGKRCQALGGRARRPCDATAYGVWYNCTVMALVPLVIDASAVIAVVTNEVHRPALIRLSEGAELISPFSLPAEVGNAFSAMFKRKRISLEKAKAAAAVYQEIAIRLTKIDLGHALDLSHRLDIYAYDAYLIACSLIACSLQYRAPLLTVDGGLRTAAKRMKIEVLEVTA